uniref:Transcription and mRNA export factor ENY2 n=1 Tax=Fibrocapsa japonica TaxID=94617 RepID=A0A7S2V4S5_9STRA|mmetsp:Transcript_4285/g.6413  ORF Transcript_4285/g.6413 Transcript_4285/m.6413 type:complete len:106 (+) Transcript_4285:236-553(+)|eukprot:CAMPEP_0113944220 /NCGR_PEP_ID=MMETSP1339-20121228/31727_1 /TAXON_ID=94617 /ORGANISM="Fibrocapsa japonica" /LENGTH=105 /DNA_ID=CAMNT_0000949335 /DNA_START=213 /DNA_END=530 /DNA_ORIENTATION=+ /assembly_acc=CAM_ASM_000762
MDQAEMAKKVERAQKDEQVRATIMQRLIETGEKDRLKELLRERLKDCGWRDELKEHCKEIIRNKGLEKITVDELVQEITPRGRATVPDNVKAELLQRIRKFLQST